MQVAVEELAGLERRMTVQVPALEVEQEVQKRLTSLSQRVRLDGFRPGKVPFKVVKRMYGRQVRQEVVGELMQSSFHDALTQQHLRPAGGPKLEPKSLESGKDLEFSATFEVFPEFEVAGIDGLKVERPVAEVSESDIDAMLEKLRRQRTIWNDVGRAAQLGDRVTVTFEGKLDGENFAGNKGDKVPVVLGEGKLIKDFESALVGLSVGDSKSVDVTFPEEYLSAEVAGKNVQFSVTVDGVAEPQLPEVNAEFARSFGVRDGKIEGLRETLKENMERELKDRVNSVVKQQIMQGLLDANEILLPQAMVDDEIERLAKQAGLPSSTADNEDLARATRKVFDEQARRRVALGLILSRIVTVNDLKVDNTRLHERLENIASTYQDSAEVIQWYQQNPQALEGVRALALEDIVVDWLLERAEITEKACSFEEAVKLNVSENTSREE